MSDSDSDSVDGALLTPEQQDAEWDEWQAGGGAGQGQDEEDDEGDATPSLFEPSLLLPSPEAALMHDVAAHGFDLRDFRRQLSLDDYGTIRLVNWIRRSVAAGEDPRPALTAAAAGGAHGQQQQAWSDDAFLTPHLPDDPLLTYEYDDDEDEQQQQQHGGGAGAAAASSAAGHAAAGAGSSSSEVVAALSVRVAALSAANEQLQLRLAAMMEAALPPELRAELREAAAEDAAFVDRAAATTAITAAAAAAAGASSSKAAAGAGPGPGSAPPGGLLVAGAAGRAARAAASSVVDACYFDSYSHLDIHHEMLSDKPRTSAYRDALTLNPSLLSGASVLDVGCGSGILSLFAARGGAADVVALDGSARIAGLAQRVAAANGLDADKSNGPVTVVAGRVEEVASLPGGRQRVSVIVSEWMGYALLFEAMLDSVLAARDRWLSPGGALLPDRAAIWVAGADARAFGCGFWRDVYGFSMAPIGAELAAAAAREGSVLVRAVEADSLTTAPARVHDMDLMTMKRDQQDFTASFDLLPAAPTGGADTTAQSVAALVLWFDCEFSGRVCREHPVTLSTSPEAPPTHWAQAVLPLKQPVALAGPGDRLACRLSMARSPAKHRCLDISLEVSSSSGGHQTMLFSMGVTGDGTSSTPSSA